MYIIVYYVIILYYIILYIIYTYHWYCLAAWFLKSSLVPDGPESWSQNFLGLQQNKKDHLGHYHFSHVYKSSSSAQSTNSAPEVGIRCGKLVGSWRQAPPSPAIRARWTHWQNTKGAKSPFAPNGWGRLGLSWMEFDKNHVLTTKKTCWGGLFEFCSHHRILEMSKGIIWGFCLIIYIYDKREEYILFKSILHMNVRIELWIVIMVVNTVEKKHIMFWCVLK